MKYQIKSVSFGNSVAHQLKHAETGESLQILPAYGGQLHQLFLNCRGKLYSLLDSYADTRPLENHVFLSYKGAKLSPFPNRIQRGTYSHNGQAYHLPCNENNRNALHGFVWNYPLSLKNVALEDDYAEITLSLYYEGKKEGYPFPYYMDITYRLSEHQLSVHTHIENKGDKDMPIGDGWHPYFLTRGKADQWQLKLPSAQRLKTDANLIPTGDPEAYKKFETLNYIQNEKLDHCFGPLNDKVSETILYHPDEKVEIVVWQKSGAEQYEWLNIYIPPDRNTIAIEPMSCAPDAFNNGLGATVLPAGKSRTYTFGVKLK